ncbi:MAG: hypothetical protein JXR58_03315 [Bacteroidales bacterium]|nr:hypothetical protein [Bacteroidales bacterium]
MIPIIGAVLLFDSYDIHLVIDSGHFSPLFSELSWLLLGKIHFSFYITLALVVLYSAYLIRLNSQNIIYETRSYLEGVIFVLLIFGTLSTKMLSPAILGSIFLLFSLNSLFKIEKGTDLSAVFNSGFYLSLGSLFFFDLIFYFPFLWISLGVIKSVSFRELLVSILGFITPIFVMGIIYFINDDLIYIAKNIENNFIFNYRLPDLKITEYLYFGWVLLLLFFSLVKSASVNQAKKIRVRKMFFIFNIFALLAISLLFATGFDINHWITATFFMAIIFTRYFLQMKSLFWSEILFFLLVLSTVAQFVKIEL